MPTHPSTHRSLGRRILFALLVGCLVTADASAQDPAPATPLMVIVPKNYDAADQATYDAWVSTWITGGDAMLLDYTNKDATKYTTVKLSAAQMSAAGGDVAKALATANLGQAKNPANLYIYVDKTSTSRDIALTTTSITVSAQQYSTNSCFAKKVDTSKLEVTTLLYSGSMGVKRDLVIIGDGHQPSEVESFDAFVDLAIMDGMFELPVLAESMSAFNIYSVTGDESTSGISVSTSASTATWKDTLLCTMVNASGRAWNQEYKMTGAGMPSWGSFLWKERTFMVTNALAAAGTASDLRVVIPNYSAQSDGGKVDGIYFQMAYTGTGDAKGKQEAYMVAAHEFGHLVGGLSDEYVDSGIPKADAMSTEGFTRYTGGSDTNASTETDPTKVSWKAYIDPASVALHPWGEETRGNFSYAEVQSVAGWSNDDKNQVVGLWEGSSHTPLDVYRPVFNCIMRDMRAPGCPAECPTFDPPCHAAMRNAVAAESEYSFDDPITGDFNGDGRADLVLAFGNSLQYYTSQAHEDQSGFRFQRGYTDIVPTPSSSDGGWPLCKGDRALAGDFDGDGKDDLLMHHPTTAACVSKLDKTGTVATPRRVAVLRSTQLDSVDELRTAFTYADALPGGWALSDDTELLVHDLDGDGKDDLIAFKPGSLASLAIYQSTGTGFTQAASYASKLPGGTSLRAGLQLRVGDFKGAGATTSAENTSGPTSLTYEGKHTNAIRTLGQSFTTTSGGELKNIQVKLTTERFNGGLLVAHLYDVSAGQLANAKPIASSVTKGYKVGQVNVLEFPPGTVLAPNTAYTFLLRTGGLNYFVMSGDGGNPYAGGELVVGTSGATWDPVAGYSTEANNDLWFKVQVATEVDTAVLYALDPTAGSLEVDVTSGEAPFAFTRLQLLSGDWSGWGSINTIQAAALADIDGDGRDELYLADHLKERPTPGSTVASVAGGKLALTAASATGLTLGKVYDGRIDDSWGAIYDRDRYVVADTNGDGKDDLVVYNGALTEPSLGMLISTGTGLQPGAHQVGTVDIWDMGHTDLVYPADYNGDGKADLVVTSVGDGFRAATDASVAASATSYTRWMGLLRSNGSALLGETVYPGWINNIPYHQHMWW